MQNQFEQQPQDNVNISKGADIIQPVPTSLQTVLQEVTNTAEQQMNSINSEEFAFTPQAYELLKGRIGEFIGDLVIEASKEARRQRSESVLKTHVEKANQYLVSSTSKRYARHFGTFGGLLLGAAISQFLSMASQGKFPTVATLVSAVLLLVGALLLAYQMAKE